MNLKQALKAKNRLVNLVKEEELKLNAYNSIQVGNVRAYSAIDTLANYEKLVKELVELKTKIQEANTPIQFNIFRLSELKNMVKVLKGLSCLEGKDKPNRYSPEGPVEYTSEINVVERDKKIREYELEIDNIQEILDTFNQITQLL